LGAAVVRGGTTNSPARARVRMHTRTRLRGCPRVHVGCV
jgi:hypothetical protein